MAEELQFSFTIVQVEALIKALESTGVNEKYTRRLHRAHLDPEDPGANDLN